MGEKVELSVQSDLGKIISDLQALQKKAQGAGDQIKRVGAELDKNLQQNTKRTESHFERLRDLGRRVADQLRGYFSNMAGQASTELAKLKNDLGLRKQFTDGAKGALELHDAIRKIGSALDIAGNRLIEFQQNVTNAFSRAGFGAEEAVRALNGLAGTQVSGEANVTAYALKATQLAQNGDQVGQEGDIAKEMANVIRERGGNQNDLGQMDRLGESVRGRNPYEKLQTQRELYSGMDDNMRKQIGPDAMRGIGAVAKVVGPEIIGALMKELTGPKLARIGKDAQGLGGIFTSKGIDFDKLKRAHGIINRIGFDKTASAGTAGLGEEASKGFVKLFEHFDEAKSAQARAMNGGGDLETDTSNSRGLVENHKAVRNQVGGVISNAVAPVIGAANGLVADASKSKWGSLALMAGEYGGAALAGGGMAALSKHLGGKLGNAGAVASDAVNAAGMEKALGQDTIPVWVVNINQLSGSIGAKTGSSLPGGKASLMDKTGVAEIGLAVGLAVGGALEGFMNKYTQGKSSDGQMQGNWAEQGMYFVSKAMAPLLEPLRGMSEGVDAILKMGERGAQEKRQREIKQPTKTETRGASQGAAK